MSELQIALRWLNGHDTGISSKAIMSQMLGEKPEPYTHPHDPSDLGRCLRLLRLIPAWRSRIGEMASVSKVWKRLAAHWDELEAMMDGEVGIDWEKGKSAPKTYDRMRQIIEGKHK